MKGPAPHRAWSAALLAAVLALVAAFWIDPETGQADRVVAQLRIARGGLFVLAGGMITLWLLRSLLEMDLRAAIEGWRNAPDSLRAGDVVPPIRPQAVGRALWVVAIGWFSSVGIGLALAARWVFDLTFENGPLETLTVLSYLGGLVFAGWALWPRLRPLRDARGNGQPRRWFLLLAAFGCFLIAAEETDWGQTYFRYATPETFEHANIQGDFSLHNLALPESVGVTRWANWGLRVLGWGLGGGVALLLLCVPAFRRLMWALDVPVPPWWSQAVLFTAACIPEIEGIYERNNVGSELREVSIAVAVCVWLWTAWARDRRPGGEHA